MPERRNIFLHGLSLTLRRLPALLWTYVFNLGLAFLFSITIQPPGLHPPQPLPRRSALSHPASTSAPSAKPTFISTKAHRRRQH